ncbi:MAG: terpene cyclase/mutase family protein [Bacteroidota bacterium]|nr:terpene cyclase/mutase family protein [Bacteroidota bacterium]
MNRKILFILLLLCSGTFAFTMLVSWNMKLPEPKLAAIEASVIKSFSLLQESGVKFIAQGKCAGCHHSTLTSMVAEKMRSKGITKVDTTAALRVMAMSNTVRFVCNPNLNNQFVQAKFLAPYVLLGLGAEDYPADLNTDIAVDYLMGQELSDGSFKAEYIRVPLECGDIHLTAFATRAIQLYASPAMALRVKKLVTQTRDWLEKQNPVDQQEIAFQLLGLQWTSGSVAAKKAAAQRLLSLQRSDGGWSQLPTMQSDAYATGQALFALSEAGLMGENPDAYEHGIDFLLKTQDSSGAWIVTTRSNPIQPYINVDFPPYDENQYISAAATNWAALALVNALPKKR